MIMIYMIIMIDIVIMIYMIIILNNTITQDINDLYDIMIYMIMIDIYY